MLKKVAATFIMMASYQCNCGELPEVPDELQYPNIVKPIYEYKAWGYASNQLNDPYTCRHNPDGNLLISDFENHLLKIYNFEQRSFEPIYLKNKQGEHLKFLLPYAAQMTKDGHIFVVDRSSNKLLEFDSQRVLDREYVASTPHPLFSEASKLSIHNDKIAVADTGNNRIIIFRRGTNQSITLGHYGRQDTDEFAGPESVAFDNSGNLYVLDSYNNRVVVFDNNYKYTKSWGKWGSFKGFLANPSDIFIGNDNTLYVSDLLNHRIQAFDLNGKFKFQFGRHPPEAHEGAGRVHYPTSVSVSDLDGSLIVCEPFESRFQKFAISAVSQVANVNDSAWWDKATKFHYGARVVASTFNLVVTEPDTHALLFFKLDGQKTTLAQIVGGQGSDPGQFDRPAGIAIDTTNNKVLISDSGNLRIQEFQIETSKTSIGNNKLLNEKIIPNDIELAGQDRKIQKLKFISSHTIMGDGDNLFEFKNDLPVKPKANEFGKNNIPNKKDDNLGISPSAIHIGPDNILYVADPYHNRILGLDKDYKAIKTIGETKGPNELNLPLDFSFSKDGKYIFIVDHYNYRLMKYSIDGKFITQIGGAGSQPGKFVLPFGVQSGQDGFVYVTDVGAQRVEKFDEDGKFIMQWGQWGTGPGQFYKPKGISQLSDGTLVVLDFGNHRAQMFDQNGKFVRTFGIENAVVDVVRP